MATPASIDTARLGTDLVLPALGETIPVTASGDLPTVTGRVNVEASLVRRIATFPGSLLHRPTYGGGLPGQVEEADTPTNRSRLARDIRANLLRDVRIADVRVSVRSGRPDDADADSTITVAMDYRLQDEDRSQSLSLTVGV